MSFWGPVIGGIASLFGSKKQKTESSVDYVKMARNAIKAGFNPLTVLRNGGSAGFTSTVHHPGLSGVADAVGQIGGALGGALDNKIDPIAQKRDQVESALLDYQLDKIQSSAKAPMMFGDVPTKTGSSLVRQNAPPMSNKSAPPQAVSGSNAPGVGTIVGGDNPKVSGLGWNNGRYGVFHDPRLPDGETLETIYGDSEILSTLYGAGKLLIGDSTETIARNARSATEDFGAYWEKVKKRALKTAKPATAHQSDPGSWMDFAPRAPKTTW